MSFCSEKIDYEGSLCLFTNNSFSLTIGSRLILFVKDFQRAYFKDIGVFIFLSTLWETKRDNFKAIIYELYGEVIINTKLCF